MTTSLGSDARSPVPPATSRGGVLGEADGVRRGWRPGIVSAAACYAGLAGLWLLWPQMSSELDPLTAYTTVLWTLPTVVTVQGLVGLVVVRRRLATGAPPSSVPTVASDMLVVVVPTVARHDTLTALRRVVRACVTHLPAHFARLRVDVVVDEGSPAERHVRELARLDPRVRVLVVPRSYATPRGTRFKARANQYADDTRHVDGEARADVWVLHLDDDTDVRDDTAEALARFVAGRRADGTDPVHLTQGVLTYPRELAEHRLTWLADAVRPGCDISFVAASTGTGSPRAGLHGELLCVRASVEHEIGWDFGPRSLVEDAEFAIRFCDRFPGGSRWLPARCYGASPATVGAFVRQRERWFRGLAELVWRRDLPLRARLLLLCNTVSWSCGPFGHPVVVLLIAAAIGDFDTLPVAAVLLPVQTLNLAFWTYLYWEGLRLNALSSSRPRRSVGEAVAVVVGVPLLTLLECVAIVKGMYEILRRAAPDFTVIAKPR